MKLPKRYHSPKAGQWVQPIQKGYRMQCCDCGLVHRMEFRVAGNASGYRQWVQFRVWRDERETRRRRKARGA